MIKPTTTTKVLQAAGIEHFVAKGKTGLSEPFLQYGGKIIKRPSLSNIYCTVKKEFGIDSPELLKIQNNAKV